MKKLLLLFLLAYTSFAQSVVSTTVPVSTNMVLLGRGTNFFNQNATRNTPTVRVGGLLTGFSSLTQLQDTSLYPTSLRQAGQMARLTSGVEYILESDLTTWTPVDNKQTGNPFLFSVLAGYTNYWSIGDSHTYGGVVATTNWTSANRLLPEYRYPNIIASEYGLNLTNLAGNGTKIIFDTNSVSGRNNTMNQAKVLANDWSGVVSIMHGYNDAIIRRNQNAAFLNYRNAFQAVLARLFSTNYFNALGEYRDGTPFTFSTDGTLNDDLFVGDQPFPSSDPATQTRHTLLLTGSQSISFTLTNAATLAFHFDLWRDGGDVFIYTNGFGAGSLSLLGQSDQTTYQSPAVAIVSDIPANTSITITNQYGTNRFMAVSFLAGADDAAIKKRRVVLGNPIKTGNGTRVDGWNGLIGRSAFQAAQYFADYPVWVADTSGRISTNTMLAAPYDYEHFNPIGQKAIAQAMMEARQVGSGASGVLQDRLVDTAGFIADSVQVKKAITTIDPVPGGMFGVYSAGVITDQPTNQPTSLWIAWDPQGNTNYYPGSSVEFARYHTLKLQASSVAVDEGSFAVLDVSGASNLPQKPALTLSLTRTPLNFVDAGVTNLLELFESYVQSWNWNTASNQALPLILQGSQTIIPNPLQVEGTISSFVGLRTNVGAVIGRSGNRVYFDAAKPWADATGPNQYPFTDNYEYYPLEVRTSGANFSQGSLQISGASVMTNLFGITNLNLTSSSNVFALSQTGGAAFIQAVQVTNTSIVGTNSIITVTNGIPLIIGSGAATIKDGPLYVIGYAGDTNNLNRGPGVLLSYDIIDTATSFGYGNLKIWNPASSVQYPFRIESSGTSLKGGAQVTGNRTAATNLLSEDGWVAGYTAGALYTDAANPVTSTFRNWIDRALTRTFSVGSSPVAAMILTNSTTAGTTRMYLYDVDNGTLEQVTVGAADSGGVGFKVLRIPN